MLRRLYHDQPDGFAFTADNQRWAEAQITKYPEGRQASAIIPLLWRAQEQEGWLSRPAIEHVAGMLGMAYIRALEVATFYFMFQLEPVGDVAHVQVCGTTSCMIMGAEDLIAVCREKIATRPHQRSEDGALSWEEVECLGACSNAPMAQIGKDYYEDLTPETFAAILDRLRAGEVPRPGSQTGRFASEPSVGLTSLTGDADHETNASVTLATEIGDTVRRIDGTEVPLRTPWTNAPEAQRPPDGGRDDLLGPRGPDAPQGRRPGDADPDRHRGAASDERAEGDSGAPGVERKGHPPEGEAAPEPETDAKLGDTEAAGGTGTSVPGSGRAKEEDEVGGAAAATGDDAPDDGGAGAAETGSEGDDAGASQSAGGADGDAAATADGAGPGGAGPGGAGTGGAGSGPKRAPGAIDGPRDGGADDLKRIDGVGPKLEQMLNERGVWHFDQIAAWSDADLDRLDESLDAFPGRARRDDWIGQAKRLSDDGREDGSDDGDA